jgi:hypothetical protein
MKYYGIASYNSQGQPCGHYAWCIADHESISEFVGQYDRMIEISEQEFREGTHGSRHRSDAAKAEEKKATKHEHGTPS